MIRIPYDVTDLIFRLLFSLIFLGLGAEHLFHDELIQEMMPDYMVYKRFLSVCAGCVLILGGLSVMFGFFHRTGAVLLGLFLITVTIMIHGQGIIATPESLPDQWHWLWNVYQRSNFTKNLCLLGVCFHLLNHNPGKYSIDNFRYRRSLQSDCK